MITREAIEQLEVLLKAGVENKAYDNVSAVISQVSSTLEQFGQNINNGGMERAILLIGPTGSGKTTTLHYLQDHRLFYHERNYIGGIYPDNNVSMGEVGHKNRSTTLIPNRWVIDNIEELQGVNLLDCAGNFDVDGDVAEILNIKTRLVMSQHIKQVKVVFVITESSLGKESSYGELFKKSVVESAKFLGDISQFDDGMGIVVSQAAYSKNIDARVLQNVEDILQHQAFQYRDSIQKILSNRLIKTFAKSPELEEGSKYPEPNSWQLEDLKKLLVDIPFVPVPRDGFFQVSTSDTVRSTMKNVYDILVARGYTLLQNGLGELMQQPFRLHVAETKLFIHHMKDIVLSGYARLGITDYVTKVFGFNKFFSISVTDDIQQLNDEIYFVSEFLDGGVGNTKIAWGTGPMYDILNKITGAVTWQSQTSDKILFAEIASTEMVEFVGYSRFSENARDAYLNVQSYERNLAAMEVDKGNPGSHFYDDTTAQVLTGKTIKEARTSTMQVPKYKDELDYSKPIYSQEKEKVIPAVTKKVIEIQPVPKLKYYQEQHVPGSYDMKKYIYGDSSVVEGYRQENRFIRYYDEGAVQMVLHDDEQTQSKFGKIQMQVFEHYSKKTRVVGLVVKNKHKVDEKFVDIGNWYSPGIYVKVEVPEDTMAKVGERPITTEIVTIDTPVEVEKIITPAKVEKYKDILGYESKRVQDGYDEVSTEVPVDLPEVQDEIKRVFNKQRYDEAVRNEQVKLKSSIEAFDLAMRQIAEDNAFAKAQYISEELIQIIESKIEKEMAKYDSVEKATRTSESLLEDWREQEITSAFVKDPEKNLDLIAIEEIYQSWGIEA